MKLIKGILVFLLGYFFIYIINNFRQTLKKIVFIGEFVDDGDSLTPSENGNSQTKGSKDMYLIVIFYTIFFMLNF
jgi:hypothetical protein